MMSSDARERRVAHPCTPGSNHATTFQRPRLGKQPGHRHAAPADNTNTSVRTADAPRQIRATAHAIIRNKLERKYFKRSYDMRQKTGAENARDGTSMTQVRR